jgi:type IV pilus assembly protein PilC
VLGEVYDKIVTSRVLYSLSTMLDVGITLNQALARAETTAGNALTAFRLGKARMDLADGVGVTDCFRMNQLFSPSALHLINAGEEAAKLAEMFGFVARLFDEEVEYAVQSASSILEPIIMIVMGFVVGFIVISAALPTLQLLQNFT